MSDEGRIAAAFARHRAFIPFVTCGDPSLDVTEELVRALDRAGADLIELGIPFSDPTAEGPVIQEANVRALSAGVTTDAVLDLAERLCAKVEAPLLFMTYANVLYAYGVERFCARAAEAGIAGVILPDVPFEEKAEFDAPCRAHGLELVSLIAPTSEDRVGRIARAASGFVYCVSSLGVTGVRSEITTDVGAMVRLVREARAEAGLPPIPCAVGFGISSAETAGAMAAQSDGAIVGSAIVRLVAEHGPGCVPVVETFARELAEAVHAV